MNRTPRVAHTTVAITELVYGDSQAPVHATWLLPVGQTLLTQQSQPHTHPWVQCVA
jgi:hypothetical protein